MPVSSTGELGFNGAGRESSLQLSSSSELSDKIILSSSFDETASLVLSCLLPLVFTFFVIRVSEILGD